MKELKMVLDGNGRDVLGIGRSSYVDACAMVANVAQAVTVPAGARYVNFSSTADFYVKFGGTAAVPGAVTDGSASVLNPTLRGIDGAATIGLIAPAACEITLEYFA